MGISTNYYAVYGRNLEYDDALAEALYEGDLYSKFEGKDVECAIIIDGMSGDYMVVGKILFDGGDLRWGDTLDDFVEIDTSEESLKSIKDAALVYLEANIEHDSLIAEMKNGEWKLMVFAHYS